MEAEITINDFSKHLFWDVDLADFRLEDYPEFMVQRVLEYGLIEDWHLLIQFYGMETIKNSALNLKTLDVVALSFIATLLEIDKKKFKAYDPNATSEEFRRRALQRTGEEFFLEMNKFK